MAKTVVNLSDQISTWVTKTNTISDDVGDVAQLVTGDSNVVDVINTVRTLVSGFDDSAEIIAIARSGLSASGDIAYDSALGQFTVSGVDSAAVLALFSADSTLSYNSSNGVYGLAANKVSSIQLKDATLLTIYDSDGTVLKTLYGAGS